MVSIHCTCISTGMPMPAGLLLDDVALFGGSGAACVLDWQERHTSERKNESHDYLDNTL